MTCASGGALKAARAAGIVIDPAPRARATISRPVRTYRARPFDLIACLLNPGITFGATVSSGRAGAWAQALTSPVLIGNVERSGPGRRSTRGEAFLSFGKNTGHGMTPRQHVLLLAPLAALLMPFLFWPA